MKYPDLQRGDVLGCWKILRGSSPRHGQRAYLAQASCCGAKAVHTLGNLIRKLTACRACCVRGWRARKSEGAVSNA